MSSRGDEIDGSASAPSKEVKEEESCSDVTISDDEDAKVVPHMSRQRKRQKRKENVVVEQKKIRKPPPPRELIPGEVVWAKIPSFPWWPAQVLVPNEEFERIRHNKKDIFVVFFGDNSQCSWMKREKLEPWLCEEYDVRIAKKTKGLQSAIAEANAAIDKI